MNLGLQDAANLGWKLAGVLRGDFSESLLDTYHVERAGAAMRVHSTSAVQIRLGTMRGRFKRRLRDQAFAAAYRSGLLQRSMARLLAQTDFSYSPTGVSGAGRRRPGRLGSRRARIGDRLPLFAAPRVSTWVPELDSDRHVVLAWPGRGPGRSWPGTVAGLRTQLGGGTIVHDLALLFGRNQAETRSLRAALGGRPGFLVVRPDGHLDFRAPISSPGSVVAHLLALRPAPADDLTTSPAAEGYALS
jgi:hypothetical protein